ncbi:DUF1605-domain-containing protein [Yamadazyma tenuis ATCC 10573]|uniref:DUF1605-domain-containing protein n=2 Tax=Candida tenuis TaxID=2315449 RepID=G3BBQ1_CANTC|nr:DUF1605-domain-containing protein [Yamadazyma tenuis ATCC 10573]EGV62207.1 DUF1605-domain-containing protein [Yamadazyma tenuis ATCC 10573]
MSNFPMEPSLSKLIILASSSQFKCSLEILIIVSMLSVPNIFYRPKERVNEADSAREKFVVGESDHLTLLNVYQQWEVQLRKPSTNMGKLMAWSNRNFLNNKSLLRAREIKNQLVLIMKKMKLPITKAQDDETVKKCLCACFFNSAARLSKLNLTNTNSIEYVNLRHSFMKMYLHPTSCLNNSANVPPSFVIYHELILTAKEYMSCVTAVDPLWLLEFGYIFYGVSKHDQKKFLSFDIGFDLIDKGLFAAGLEADKKRFGEKKAAAKQPVSYKETKVSRFKTRRGI